MRRAYEIADSRAYEFATRILRQTPSFSEDDEKTRRWERNHGLFSFILADEGVTGDLLDRIHLLEDEHKRTTSLAEVEAWVVERMSFYLDDPLELLARSEDYKRESKYQNRVRGQLDPTRLSEDFRANGEAHRRSKAGKPKNAVVQIWGSSESCDHDYFEPYQAQPNEYPAQPAPAPQDEAERVEQMLGKLRATINGVRSAVQLGSKQDQILEVFLTLITKDEQGLKEAKDAMARMFRNNKFNYSEVQRLLAELNVNVDRKIIRRAMEKLDRFSKKGG